MTTYFALRDQAPDTVAVIGGPYDDPDDAADRCETAEACDNFLVETMVSTEKALQLSLTLSGADLEDHRDEFTDDPEALTL